jgi:chemosensory pili system protein ChpA (sensor histidine kinase/response regulator)
MEFDLGSLTWVKGELDNALDAARGALTDWNGEDSNPLKAAAAHLHQVYGALQIVDLQGVSQLANESERLLADMITHDHLRNAESCEIVLNAIGVLKGYLDELMTGAPLVELRLAPTLRSVMTRRGLEAPPPSEMFYPDTSVRVPRSSPEMQVSDEERNRVIRTARLRYQKGLLKFLQNREAAEGLQEMQHAIGTIEKLAPGPAQHTFWWTAAGLMEALRRGGVPTDFWLKRLCGRIDLQMRRLMDGSRQLADRLFRDMLFHVAQDSQPGGRSEEARNLFNLAHFFPQEDAVEDAGARALLSTLRENLASAKDHWIRYCAGRTESLQPFQQAALALFEAATHLPNPDMQSLTRIVQAVAKRLPGEADATHNEALQLEMATALLLAQNAAEHYAALGDEFAAQSGSQAMRLQAAIDPNFDTSRIPDVAMLDEISRAAQEKLVMAQVTQEIHANLNQVEEVLDRFFRNANERAGLPALPSLMRQILGALNILQLDTAADLVREAIKRIEHFTATNAEGEAIYIAPENLNWVAEALSTLGIYMDAKRHGRDETPILTRLLAQPEVVMESEETVESQVQADAERIKDTVQQWAESGGDDEARETLKQDLGQLARDADLIGNAELREQADAAMKVLNTTDLDAPADAVLAAVQGIGASSIEAPPPSAEAVRLAAASDEDVDQEMLSTYIEEAQDVLGSIATQVARLNVSPYDNDAFTTVRRGFHTLKGSGRMVGLTNLAEPAWEIEQTLNSWLRDEKVPSSEMLDFLETAGGVFLEWVTALEEHGQVYVESTELINAARKLRGEPSASPLPETPPPKSEAGEAARTGQTAGAPEQADIATAASGDASDAPHVQQPGKAADADVDIDGHILPAELFVIFSDEATRRLADLDAALTDMAGGLRPAAWEAFIRAAHTLAGISRTTGFQPLAEAAHEVELWASQWPDKTISLSDPVRDHLHAALAPLGQALTGIQAGHFPAAMPQVAAALALTHAESAAPQAPLAPLTEAELLASAPATPEQPPVEAEPQARTEYRIEDTTDDSASQNAAEIAAETQIDLPTKSQEAAPAAKPAAPAHDEIDEQLLPIFLEEAAELLPRIGSGLRQWRGTPDDPSTRDALKRSLHTLKGSARMAGAMVLGESVHRMETEIIEAGDEIASPAYLDALETAYDHLTDLIDRLRPEHQDSQTESAAPVAPGEPDGAEPALGMTPTVAAPTRPGSTRMDAEMHTRQSLRLKSDIMDTLLNEAGEVSIARARIENVLASYKQTAQELASNVERLRAQLRELEIQAESQMHSRLSHMEESQFDPLEFDRFSRLQELTRLMAESVNDVSTAQDNLLSGLNETDNALLLQARMTRNLQQELMHIRMVPLDTLAERLYRVVRQSAKETGRKAQLELDGGHTELDRAVLDKIAAPLEHLVRNAVAHGIEPPEQRLACGKAEYGELRLSARQEGNEIVISLSDDGAGIDLAAVRKQAESRGWLKPGEEASDEQLEQMLFRSGFSTARQVTEIAGRGVGLDVVKNEIAGIGGRVKLESEAGKGVRFTIRLPLTLALTQVVLTRAGGQTWALPASLIALVREYKVDQVQELHELGQLELDGKSYPCAPWPNWSAANPSLAKDAIAPCCCCMRANRDLPSASIRSTATTRPWSRISARNSPGLPESAEPPCWATAVSH